MATKDSKQARVEFGARLRAALERAGISHRTLAKQLGVSHGLVSHWIAGRSSPSPEMLAQIGAILNVDLNELLGVPPELRARSGLTPEQEAIANHVLNQLVKKLAQNLDQP